MWSSEQTCVVKLVDREAVMDKLVYTATNPVQDHLVDRGHLWPGVNGLRALLARQALRAIRPLHFFRPTAPRPMRSSCRSPSPLSSDPPPRYWRSCTTGYAPSSSSAQAERARTGRRVLGRRAVRAQSWCESPTSVERGRNLRPRVATRNKWARIEALLRNRAFVVEYAMARDRWRTGIPAVFPPGTYWLKRFASVPVGET